MVSHFSEPLKGFVVKLNSRLKLSRHGVFYFRYVVPLHLRTEFGTNEIKRSLKTKVPKLAQFYAHYLAIKLTACMKKSEVLSVLSAIDLDDIKTFDSWGALVHHLNISKWIMRDGDFSIEADPNNPNDLKSAEKASEAYFAAKFNQISQQRSLIASAPKTKISDIIPQWIERISTENPNKKTIDEYHAKLLVFKKHVGDIAITNITAKVIADFVTGLVNGKVTGKNISASGTNKYISAINSFFLHAQRIGEWPQDKPFPTLKQKIKSSASVRETSYQPFNTEDLNLIFKKEHIFGWKEMGGHQFAPHMLWLPLLGLFTGARLEELCQLMHTDIYEDEDQVWVIDINDIDGKHLKTKAATRKIPLHPQLIDLGFLVYLNDVKANFKSEKLIFPYLTANKYSMLSSGPSKWFARFLQKIGIESSKKVFHSFRSTANNALKTAGIEEEIRCQMIGHQYLSTNSNNYSTAHTPKWLLDNVIPKLRFKNLNLSNLVYEKGQFNQTLSSLVKNKNGKQAHLAARK
jgi:integrase